MVVYLVLLVLSAFFPFFSSLERISQDEPVLVPAFDFKGDKVTQTDRQIPVHAKLHGFAPDGTTGGKPVLIYLHRAPWDSRGSQFCADLARTGQVAVIEPFLPGFATSPGNVPSHSMEANAEVVASLVEHYGVKEYHVLGQGLGGVAALELAAAHPDRVRSLTMLSAPGAQEFELLGNPLVNKIVYGFQGAFFWGVSRLTPNFGAADLLPWDRDYAATVFDTDLSDSKKILFGWRKPLLIVHGQDDWLTPAQAATYSAQLVPQAKLVMLPGGHDVVFAEQAKVVAEVLGFVAAPPAVTVAAPTAYPPLPSAAGAHYWILLVIIVICTFVAEDPTCLATGLMVAVGIIDFWSGAAACTVGIFIGDLVLYSVGRFFGRQAITKAPFKWFIKESKVNQWAGWFSTPQGLLVVVSSRFIPASRVPTFVTAGIMKLNIARLGGLLLLAALIWTPPLMYLGYKFGAHGMELLARFKSQALWIILGFIFALHFVTHWIVPALTWRGRRQIVMKVRNLLQASLWPSWLLYFPIRVGILALCLRHRRLTAFASANPALGRIGGFIGDSKSLLMRPFQRDSRCCPLLALSMEDSVEQRLKEAHAFAACHGYPLVFKPEVGEDGAGMRYIRTPEQLDRWVAWAKEDFLLQKKIDGLEFEVVWRRNPGKDDGRVLVVVQKQDVVVMGDGEETLEELIWLDEVAVSRGELYLECHDRDLNRVVPAGEKVVLNLSGSYGHGARCVHRHDLNTPELSAAMTTFAKRFPGLHFGRFDLRAVSEEEFKAGRFMVTEVGGCCHVSSLVRDESLRFSRAYGAVWTQLKACIEAGAYNLAQRVRPVPLDECLARWSQARGRDDLFSVSEP
jgi:pimeloyl-ACP methyl ester carboxylesterase/membrane protein DedA with SNARE-associated domain